MLQPFETPSWEAIQASGVFTDLPPSHYFNPESAPFTFRRSPIAQKHDPECATVSNRSGLAGLGQVSITPLMQAIAQAEGFNVAGSIPQRANNPGDLEVGDIGYGTLGQGITVFGSVDDGWAALANQINMIVTGQSSYYSPTESLAQVGATYSGGDPNWANNVSSILGVSVNTPFASLAGGTEASPPAVLTPEGMPSPLPTIGTIPTSWLVGGAAAAVLVAAVALT